jgi:hypothetical protein
LQLARGGRISPDSPVRGASKLPIPLSREKNRDFFSTTLEIPKFHRKSANFASKHGTSREFPNSSLYHREQAL